MSNHDDVFKEAPKEGELIAEYDCSENVRFADCTMRDSQGKEVLCKCGKPAGMSIIGVTHCVSYCTDCSPLNKSEAKFVFVNPLQSKAGLHADR